MELRSTSTPGVPVARAGRSYGPNNAKMWWFWSSDPTHYGHRGLGPSSQARERGKIPPTSAHREQQRAVARGLGITVYAEQSHSADPQPGGYCEAAAAYNSGINLSQGTGMDRFGFWNQRRRRRRRPDGRQADVAALLGDDARDGRVVRRGLRSKLVATGPGASSHHFGAAARMLSTREAARRAPPAPERVSLATAVFFQERRQKLFEWRGAIPQIAPAPGRRPPR